MPNKYKQTVGSRLYKNYTEHTLQRCLLAVKTKQMTQQEAEKAFKIPRLTIINKLKAHHVQPVGRPTVFTEPEENNFVGDIHVMSEYGFPIDKTDLKFIIKSYLDRNGRHVKFFNNNLLSKITILQKQSFPGLLKKLLDVLEPTLKTTLQNGFRKCDIFPCGVEELLNRLPNALNASSSVKESFIEH
ncbi:unnamed protein product [Macrosiphum euphorbiae]|uniref:HTH psq-type domain-containing protein n=1 Tax=Macrosiphum euphorbiae TaxID=13131 RepID=A0AAV0Y3E7_9HEMI|nr:unnamed protein product [Macrosiphum euphorbiae]